MKRTLFGFTFMKEVKFKRLIREAQLEGKRVGYDKAVNDILTNLHLSDKVFLEPVTLVAKNITLENCLVFSEGKEAAMTFIAPHLWPFPTVRKWICP